MLKVFISETNVEMGIQAAKQGAEAIRNAVKANGEATIVVATAPSQNQMYDALVREDVPWSKVRIFHLDEYIGLKPDHPASFRFNLHKTFLDRLPEKPMEFIPVEGENTNPKAVCKKIGKKIGQYKLDVAFIGIGENGHIAFNDPPADFNSPNAYNPVTLDEVCRHQQYGEGWFPTMDAVPKIAISMSVPQIFSAKVIINTVPDTRKAAAVKAAVEGPVTNMCPASILQTHPDCRLFLDKAAASKLKLAKLAINGGTPVFKGSFPAWPQFNPKTDKVVLDILHSGKVNYWTGQRTDGGQGSIGMQFEEAWAKWLGVKNAISVTNGTAALHTALGGLGIGPGDEVICTSYSFIASSFCALQAGALPVFVDVGTDHLMDPTKIEAAITERTKAIVVVHLYGMVADMDPIMAIAKKHNLYVIEDCAQCFGGVYKGKKAGTIGTVGCFSFCQSKHFTTGGEGGMVCTNDDDLAWECRSFRDHGYDVRAKLNLLMMEGKQLYIHRRVGFNFRMTEIQSAIGLGELERFDSWNLPQRKKLGKMLIKGLAKHPLVKYPPVDTKDRQNCFWLVPFVLDTDKLTCTCKEFIAAVQKEGALAYSVLWPEMYKEEAYTARKGFGVAGYPFNDPRSRNIDYSKFNCEMAHWLTDRTISFWTHPTYTEKHIQADIDAFKKVADAYMKK